MKSLSGTVNKITDDNCKCMDKRRGGQGHGSGSLPILHQAGTWSLTSPVYNDAIHLTGVYIFPVENQLQEFFDILIAHSNHPPQEPHIQAGDFNAYTAEELKNHLTPHELRTLLPRSGDINPAHTPAPPLTSATVPAADYRGRLLLNMTNSLELIITNGRFPVPPPTLRPYTFFRKPNTHSVLDYNLIAKHHVPLIQKCEVLRDSLPAGVTDHMPIHLHLDLPTTPTPALKPTSQSSPPRTLYHSKRLKDKDTKEAFTRALAKKVLRITPTIQKLYTQLQGKKISPQLFADTANSEITSVLQKTALDILTQIDPSPHTRTTANPHVKPSNHHSSRDPHEALLQRTIQLHRDALTTLRKDLSLDDTDTLTYRQNKLKQAQNDLLKSHLKKSRTNYGPTLHVTMEMTEYLQDQILALCGIISENTKKNHAKNLLPPETGSNASTDTRIWESRPATLNFLNWQCYRFALGHHLFNHKLSPYDEKEAKLIFSRHASGSTSTGVHYHTTLRSLLMIPLALIELTTQIKKPFPDKSSGPSGITNWMLQAGDAEFQSLILLLFNGIWESHVQPTDWQLSLMQPSIKRP